MMPSGLRDNHRRGSVGGYIRDTIRDKAGLSFVSAYFTIYAYEALKDVLHKADHLDFLFGEPSFINRLDPERTQKKAFILEPGGLTLANRL